MMHHATTMFVDVVLKFEAQMPTRQGGWYGYTWARDALDGTKRE